MFNAEKLLWLNHHYIQQADPERLAALLLDLLRKEGLIAAGSKPDLEWFKKLVKILTERSHTLVEMKAAAIPFITETITMDEKAKTKHLTPDVHRCSENCRRGSKPSSPLPMTRSRRCSARWSRKKASSSGN